MAIGGAPRVLILSVAFPPWGGGGVIRIAKLAKYLPEFGWDVTVVCSDERTPIIRDESLLDEIPPDVRILRVRGPLNRLGGAATLHVAAGWAEGKRRGLTGAAITAGRALVVPDRWIGWAARVSGLSAEVLHHPDVILSSGPPHSTHLAGARLSRRFQVPYVMDLRDEWAADVFDQGKTPWQRAANDRLESLCVRRARRVVVVSPGMAARLAHRRRLTQKIVTIPNGFDRSDLDGVAVRQVPRPEQPTRFLYAGRLVATQLVGRFFEVLGSRMRAGASASFVSVGLLDPYHAALMRQQIPAGRLDVRPPVSHRAAINAMASAHVLVVFTGGGGAGDGTMTGKLYEYLALRRPVLLIGPDGDAAHLVQASGAGMVARPDDTDSIGNAIDRVMQMAIDPGFAGASDDILERFDRRTLAGLWSDMLSTTGGRPRGP